ncbi:hypothetical protein KUCAC02_033428, partial [Chaenocephalus aceratus]
QREGTLVLGGDGRADSRDIKLGSHTIAMHVVGATVWRTLGWSAPWLILSGRDLQVGTMVTDRPHIEHLDDIWHGAKECWKVQPMTETRVVTEETAQGPSMQLAPEAPHCAAHFGSAPKTPGRRNLICS